MKSAHKTQQEPIRHVEGDSVRQVESLSLYLSARDCVSLCSRHWPKIGQWLTCTRADGPVSSYRSCQFYPSTSSVAFNVECGLATYTQSCQVEVVEFLESFPWSGVPKSRRDSVGGGGVVAPVFRDLHLREVNSLPHIQWYSWVETHISDKYDKSQDFLRQQLFITQIPSIPGVFFTIPGGLEITRHFWRLPGILGDLAGLYTHASTHSHSNTWLCAHAPTNWDADRPKNSHQMTYRWIDDMRTWW